MIIAHERQDAAEGEPVANPLSKESGSQVFGSGAVCVVHGFRLRTGLEDATSQGSLSLVLINETNRSVSGVSGLPSWLRKLTASTSVSGEGRKGHRR